MSDPIADYYTFNNRYPANNQSWFIAKDADGAFDPELMNGISWGTSPAPKGHFILEAFNPTRFPSEDTVINSTVRPSTNTFFAGRLWMGGIATPELSGRIYYSQLLEDISKVGKCYNDNDPTSEEFNEPLDTDGGVIKIPEAGDIQALEAVGNGVVVIANNGIWFVRGGENGFTPTSHTVTKVSSFGSTSPYTVESVGNNIFYWGEDGIYTMGYSELEGLSVQDITASTIFSLYKDIPRASKSYARALYNANDKKVHWFYRSTATTGDVNRFDYDRVLTFDLQLQAFTTYTIQQLDANTPQLVGALERPTLSSINRNDPVVVGVDSVVVGGSAVCVTSKFEDAVSVNIKAVAMVLSGGVYKFTFADFNNDNFLDWESVDSVGKDAAAFAIPAYETFDEPSREKRASYVTAHFNRTETGFDTSFNALNPSGCFMQAKWDWSDADITSRGAVQQIYRLPRTYIPLDSNDNFVYGNSVITSRTKIRGSGKALSLKFESEPLKDLQLLGWTTNVSIRA